MTSAPVSSGQKYPGGFGGLAPQSIIWFGGLAPQFIVWFGGLAPHFNICAGGLAVQ
jgi:hypothetical protein